MSATTPTRYDRTSILPHWVTATLVVLLWLIAHWIDDFPRGTARITARSVHILLGVTLLAVAGLHALAALAHHYFRRDGVLKRMLPDSE